MRKVATALEDFFAERHLDDPDIESQRKVREDFTAYIRMRMQNIFLGGEDTTDLRVDNLPRAVVERAWKIFVPSYKKHILKIGGEKYGRKSFEADKG